MTDVSTLCVNVKVQYLRPQYQNLKQWCEASPNHVYIGRRGIVFIDNVRYPPRDSIWANPFKVGQDKNGDLETKQSLTHLIEMCSTRSL